MKKILISIILLSICYSSSDEGLSNAYPLRGSEYSLGISDKVGFFGFSSHSWVTRQESFETYITIGTSMIILGSIIPICLIVIDMENFIIVSGLLVLIGIFLTEFVRIRIPQMIPLS